MTAVHLEIPDLRTVLRHAAPRFIESTLVPLVLFMVGLRVLGVWGAMIAGLVWVYSAILVRAITRRPIPGILLLGALTLTARTVIALASRLGRRLLLATVARHDARRRRVLAFGAARQAARGPPRRRLLPAARRRAREHARAPLLPPDLAAVGVRADARMPALTVWLLFSQSLGTFVVMRSVVSTSVTIARDRRLGALVQAQHEAQRHHREASRAGAGPQSSR